MESDLEREMFDLLAAAIIEEHQHGPGALYDLELARIAERVMGGAHSGATEGADLAALDALLRVTVSTITGSLCWAAAISEEDAGQFIADFIDESRNPRSE